MQHIIQASELMWKIRHTYVENGKSDVNGFLRVNQPKEDLLNGLHNFCH